MLQADYFDDIAMRIESIYLGFTNWTYQEIARRMAAAGELTASAEYQIRRAAELGAFAESYKTRLKELSSASAGEIDRIFTEAAEMAHGYDEGLFTATGIPFAALPDNPELQRLARTAAAQMNTEIGTLTNSTALKMIAPGGQRVTIPRFYSLALDNAAFQVSAGVTSYSEAIRRTVSDMVRNGITVVRYEGENKKPVNRRIEGVVRTTVLTAVSQMADKVAWQNIATLGAEHVIMSQHAGARTGEGFRGHINWQGRVFALGKFSPKEVM